MYPLAPSPQGLFYATVEECNVPPSRALHVWIEDGICGALGNAVIYGPDDCDMVRRHYKMHGIKG